MSPVKAPLAAKIAPVNVPVAAEMPFVRLRAAKVGVEVVRTDWFMLAPITLPVNVPVAAEMPPERLIFAPLSKSVRVVVAAERPPISERPAKVGVEVVSTDWFTLAPVTLPVKVAPVPESDPVSVVVAAERAPEKVPVAAEIPPVRFIPAKVGLEVVCVD